MSRYQAVCRDRVVSALRDVLPQLSYDSAEALVSALDDWVQTMVDETVEKHRMEYDHTGRRLD